MKSQLRDWMPPIFLRRLSSLWGGGVTFTGDYNSWAEAASQCVGYGDDEILAKVLDSTLKVKSGEAVFERDSVLFDEIQYSWPLLSGLMLAAARNGGNLRVLDYGGSLGSCYFQIKKYLAELPLVEWGVVEQNNFVQAGLEYIRDDNINFFKTIGECALSLKPNVVLLSSVLQYVEEPEAILLDISKLDIDMIVIDRTPFSSSEFSGIVVQKVPSSIYSASYPMHIISQDFVLNNLSKGWREVERVLSPEGHMVSDKGHHFSFNAIVLVRG